MRQIKKKNDLTVLKYGECEGQTAYLGQLLIHCARRSGACGAVGERHLITPDYGRMTYSPLLADPSTAKSRHYDSERL